MLIKINENSYVGMVLYNTNGIFVYSNLLNPLNLRWPAHGGLKASRGPSILAKNVLKS